MNKPSKDQKIIGSIVGGLVGLGAIGLLFAMRQKKEVPLNTISEILSHVGDILECHHIDEPRPLKSLGKHLHKNENTISEVVEWVATGINLWKKFKN